MRSMAAVEEEPLFDKTIMLIFTSQGNIDKTSQVDIPESRENVNETFV